MWNLSSRGISKNWPNSISCTDSSPTRRERHANCWGHFLQTVLPFTETALTHTHTHTHMEDQNANTFNSVRRLRWLMRAVWGRSDIFESVTEADTWETWRSNKTSLQRHTAAYTQLHTLHTHTAYTTFTSNHHLHIHAALYITVCIWKSLTQLVTITFRYYIILLNNLDIILYSYYDFFCQFIWHTR